MYVRQVLKQKAARLLVPRKWTGIVIGANPTIQSRRRSPWQLSVPGHKRFKCAPAWFYTGWEASRLVSWLNGVGTIPFLLTSTKGYVVPTWIDFKELRSKLTFDSLLRYYGIPINGKGEQHVGSCPLPGHAGSRKENTLSVNIERGMFQCFRCRAKGGVLDFAILMEGANPEDGRQVRKVALKLRRELVRDIMPVNSKRFVAKPAPPDARAGGLKVVVNAPLDFTLKGLESDHPYFAQHGLSRNTVDYFGLGYCRRGMLKGCIAIPIHDAEGQLVGYAGLPVDEDVPKPVGLPYILPPDRERNGVIYRFDPSALLYNAHRITEPVDELIVVNQLQAAWWLYEQGHAQVVVVIGSACSDEQIECIVSLVKPSGRLLLMAYGDKTGERLAQTLLSLLSPHRYVRRVKLSDGRQLSDSIAELIKARFSS